MCSSFALVVAPAVKAVDDERRPDLRAMLDEQCAADPDRQPWPADWFVYTDSDQVRACRNLWGAILLAIVRDIVGADPYAVRKVGHKERHIATSYFRSRDFHTICALAGFDGDALGERLSDPVRREAIATALIGKPKGGASPKLSKDGGAVQ